MSYIVPRASILSLFERAYPQGNWPHARILDFGGNRGNLLQDAIEHLNYDPANYTCIDVDQPAVLFGGEQYPRATWIHQDRFNPVYNPQGHCGLELPFEDLTFDIAVAHSIHSHTSFESMLEDLKQLRRVAHTVITSVVSPEFVRVMARKRAATYKHIHPLWHTPTPLSSVRYYIDGDRVTELSEDLPPQCDFLIAAYNLEWLAQQLPEALIVPAAAAHLQTMLVFEG